MAAQHESLIAKQELVHKGQTGEPIRLGKIPPVFSISKYKKSFRDQGIDYQLSDAMETKMPYSPQLTPKVEFLRTSYR